MNKISINNIGKIFGILLILTILSAISYWIIDNVCIMLNIDIPLILNHMYYNSINFSDRIDGGGRRFLPLQFFDYNIFKLFNSNIRADFIPYYTVVKFWISILLFVYIIKDFEKFNKVKINLFIKLTLLLFLIIYYGNIRVILYIEYSEIFQGMFILLFTMFYQRAYFTGKLRYYILALLSVIYATYTKETMFIPFFVIGLSQLLFIDTKIKIRQTGGGITCFKWNSLSCFILYNSL
ncbi:MAG: hypothetical protein ACI4N3_00405 [Alphaproteobacteria bacterium]